MTVSTPMDTRLEAEAREIIAAATERGQLVRLLGGLGIRVLLGDRFPSELERHYGDIDVFCDKRSARGLEQLLPERGWAAEQSFNALNGSRRMLFHDPHGSAQVDVFVGAFEMCHTLPLADGLGRHELSLVATDLLMSKLQIVSLNAKDRGDLYALLCECEVADGDPAALEPGRLAQVTSADWGTQHSFELNFGRLREALPDSGLRAEHQAAAGAAIDTLTAAIDAAPKSRGWKLRARIGERKRWYEEPEEVDRHHDD